jgi:hypothetical protein
MRMETIQKEIDKTQFINGLRSMSEDDRLEVYQELRKSLFLRRFENLLLSLKTDGLSLEEITEEVEKVRQERYEAGKHRL